MDLNDIDVAALEQKCAEARQQTLALVEQAQSLALRAQDAAVRSFDLCVEADYLCHDRKYALTQATRSRSLGLPALRCRRMSRPSRERSLLS